MGHLYKYAWSISRTSRFLRSVSFRVTQHEAENAMSISNIAIVFGPTLFGLPTANAAAGQAMAQVNGMADAAYQNKVRSESSSCGRRAFADQIHRQLRPSWSTTRTSSLMRATIRDGVLVLVPPSLSSSKPLMLFTPIPSCRASSDCITLRRILFCFGFVRVLLPSEHIPFQLPTLARLLLRFFSNPLPAAPVVCD